MLRICVFRYYSFFFEFVVIVVDEHSDIFSNKEVLSTYAKD